MSLTYCSQCGRGAHICAECPEHRDRVERLEGMIRQALDELGVPGVFLEQRAPVVEAVTILRAAMENHE